MSKEGGDRMAMERWLYERKRKQNDDGEMKEETEKSTTLSATESTNLEPLSTNPWRGTY